MQTMAVAPAAQGQGLGARLLRALLEEAERRGQRTVRLEVRADNPVAQGLYARTASSARACAAATTSRAAPTPSSWSAADPAHCADHGVAARSDAQRRATTP